MTGIIVLNKPQEFTSFDAVAVMRKIAGERSIGHTGTLDPMATGVLPLLLGKATKAANLLPDTEKGYVAGFCLGIKTDTGDIWGKEEQRAAVNVSGWDIEKALKDFTGDIWQLPPMYSAVSVGGQRLYTLARRGIEIQREKRQVHIKELRLLEFDENRGTLLIRCSKGTYVRTLIEDVAAALGTLGTMSSLERTYACGFSAKDSHSLNELRELSSKGEIRVAVLPVDMLFKEYESVKVSALQESRFLNGGVLDLRRLKFTAQTHDKEIIRIYGGEFLGLGRVDLQRESLVYLKHFK